MPNKPNKAPKTTPAVAAVNENVARARTKSRTKKQGQKIVLTHPDGTKEARVDFIRRMYYDEEKDRGEIVKILNEEYNQNVVYQTVYAATKPTDEEEDSDGTEEVNDNGDSDGSSDSDSDETDQFTQDLSDHPQVA